MANLEQLRRLTQEGVENWNKWREINLSIEIDLSEASLSEINGGNFIKVNFNKANLRGANLQGANLQGANFYKADLQGANLQRANLQGANLQGADLWISNLNRANLFEANLWRAVLTEANLTEADLTKANLWVAKLNQANLISSNISQAVLIQAQVLATDFTNSTLTGACIEDWNINSNTKFDNVICDYIYLKQGQKERRPSDLNRTFNLGDFAKLVQESIETVDLIFSKGIDWQAFLTSFQELQVESEDTELTIQAIERKSEGAFVVRVEIPSDTDKSKIEAEFWNKYKPLLEAKNQEIKRLSEQTESDFQQIEHLRQTNTELLGIVKTMAEKENSKIGSMNFYGPTYGIAGNVEGNQIINLSKDFEEATAKIQNRLNQLQNQGSSQEEAQSKVANDLANEAKENPTALRKLVNWGKSIGNKAAETSVSEATKHIIKLALNLADVSMS